MKKALNETMSHFFRNRFASMAFLLTFITIMLVTGLTVGTAWSFTEDDQASSITVQAKISDLYVTDTSQNVFLVEKGSEAVFYGSGPESIRVQSKDIPDGAVEVSIRSIGGQQLEDTSVFKDGTWFRDITFTGINKIASVESPGASSFDLALQSTSPSSDRPEVGDVFSGSCTISTVSQNGEGGSLNYVICSISSGILQELGSLTAYCADHTAAAPVEGQQFTYTYTVTSVDKTTGIVEGSFYATSVSGSTDGVSTDGDGRLTGYQRVSVVASIERKYTGTIRIKKVSSISTMTSSNDLYSLDGATYRIYEDQDCTKKSDYDDIVTKEGEYVESEPMTGGTYYVKEVKAPKGFELSDKVYKVVVVPGETSDVGTEIDEKVVIPETPRRNPSPVIIGKLDNDSLQGWAQGDASLEGAEYKVEYYDGQYTTVQSAQSSGNPKKQWTFETDSAGKINMCDTNYLVSGSLYKDDDGNVVYPLGTYIFYETQPSNGYLLSDEKARIRIAKDTTTSETVIVGDVVKGSSISGAGSTYSAYASVIVVKEPPIKGSLKLEKRDLESRELAPLGGATLEGTGFQVTNKSKAAVIVAGQKYEPGDVCSTFYTNEGGIAEMAERSLPYGTYSVKEVYASEGYLLTDTQERTFTIRSDGEIAFFGQDDESGLSRKGDAFYNQVKRGDISLVKIRGDNSEHLPYIPFEITSKSSGEKHILVTDENGEAHTEAAWNPHTRNTNANDSLTEGSFDKYAGVWWALTKSGAILSPDDSLCALPYDEYTIKELPVSQNEGMELVEFDFSIERDSTTVNLGTIDNNPTDEGETPAISTLASDTSDGDKLAYASSNCKLSDQVSYVNLEPGKEYTLHATLIDVTTLQMVPGGEAYMQFTPDSSFGSVVVKIDVDSLSVAGQDVVFFEELLLDGEVICLHKDSDDDSQRVTIVKPEVSTYASDSHDADKTIVFDDEASVKDEVYIQNLEPNVSYKLFGIIVDSEKMIPALVQASEGDQSPSEDEVAAFWNDLLGLLGAEVNVEEEGYSCDVAYNSKIDTAALDSYLKDNSQIVNAINIVSKEFTASSDYMTTTLDYPISSTGLQGEHVIFDLLLNDDTVVAVHADTANADQSFEIVSPKISTTATDKTDSDHYILPSKEAKIVDLVEYSGLVSGTQYEISGTLMKKSDGKALYIDDKLIETQASFIPNSSDGSIEVAFTLDTTSLEEDTELVVFEYLSKDKTTIAEHADIDDEAQTICVNTLESTTTLGDVVPTGSSYYQTGFNAEKSSRALLSILGLCGIACVAIIIRNRFKAQRK